MDPRSTETLIRRAREGEREAFDELVEMYRHQVTLLIRKELGARLRQRIEVEDLVQEAFARAYRSIRQFRGQSGAMLQSWLSTIALRVVQDHGRLLASKGAELLSLDDRERQDGSRVRHVEELLAARVVSPSRQFRRRERFERLREALSKLNPEHRRVILLARVRELPIQEVARRMRRSPEAVSMLLLRALLKLKAAFGKTESLGLPDLSLDGPHTEDP